MKCAIHDVGWKCFPNMYIFVDLSVFYVFFFFLLKFVPYMEIRQLVKGSSSIRGTISAAQIKIHNNSNNKVSFFYLEILRNVILYAGAVYTILECATRAQDIIYSIRFIEGLFILYFILNYLVILFDTVQDAFELSFTKTACV